MPTTHATTNADFQNVHRECSAALRAFLVVRAGRNHCDDLLQDVWTRALTAWSRFDGQNAKAWLFRIAHNCLIDHHRKKKPEAMAELHHHVDERLPAADAIALEGERMRQLRDCLTKLSDDFRKVAQALLGGETADDVAARMGVNRATVYTRWHRAKEALQHCVNGASP